MGLLFVQHLIVTCMCWLLFSIDFVISRGVIKECKKSKVGFDYMGKVNVTSNGRTCQAWTSQSPHQHGFTEAAKFPDASMEDVSNYCRNPDDDRGPWCYTTDPSVRFEFCDIPFCPEVPQCENPLPGGVGEEDVPICKSSMICKRTTLGKEYSGTQSETVNGRTCQFWNSQYPHSHSNTDANSFPDISLDEAANYCRNPDSVEGGPWCYTTDPDVRFEYCGIQECRDCRTSGTGREYSAERSVAVGGLPCQYWASQTPHLHNMTDPDRFPDANLHDAQNFCRNPDNKPTGPWCYTQDPFIEWASCDINECSDEDDIYPKIPLTKHVIHIGIDGLKPSCLPNAPGGAPNILKRLGDEGTYTLTKARTSLITVSSPGWSTQLCSMTTEYSGIAANSWLPPWLGNTQAITPVLGNNMMLPCVFKELKSLNQNIRTASFYTWSWIRQMSNRGFAGYVDVEYDGSLTHTDYASDDVTMTRNATSYLRSLFKSSAEMSYTFIYQINVDEVGHATEWCGDEYMKAVDLADDQVGMILDLLEELNMADDVLIMLSADHGGLGSGHGRYADSDIFVPMFLRGPGIKKGHQLELAVSTQDMLPTAFHALGQKPSAWWRGQPMYEAFDSGKKSLH